MKLVYSIFFFFGGCHLFEISLTRSSRCTCHRFDDCVWWLLFAVSCFDMIVLLIHYFVLFIKILSNYSSSGIVEMGHIWNVWMVKKLFLHGPKMLLQNIYPKVRNELWGQTLTPPPLEVLCYSHYVSHLSFKLKLWVLVFASCCANTITRHWLLSDFQDVTLSRLLILCEGAISHNWPEITPNRTI